LQKSQRVVSGSGGGGGGGDDMSTIAVGCLVRVTGIASAGRMNLILHSCRSVLLYLCTARRGEERRRPKLSETLACRRHEGLVHTAGYVLQ